MILSIVDRVLGHVFYERQSDGNIYVPCDVVLYDPHSGKIAVAFGDNGPFSAMARAMGQMRNMKWVEGRS